ncbi:MAG: biotin--[acetyl-CoA-carboxylase] ligase [Alphaproteobacteria bacterium]|nr:biotin--[acetyl-CoA-carboxylase] ligase [Alphaproteobacteria bacterium]
MQEDFWKIIAFGSVESTNYVLKKLVSEGEATDGMVVIAQEQKAGYGRRSRKWHSPKGNLYCSALVAPSQRKGNDVTQLSFVVSVAAADAISKLSSGIDVQCKWPNDILINGKKVSGMLLETIGRTAIPLQHIVIGTGINIDNAPTDIKDIHYPVTSLSDVGIEISVQEMLTRYLSSLKYWLDEWETNGFDKIKDFWLFHAKGIGEEIKINFGKNSMSGIFTGLDADGALLLRLSDGKERRITTGDVFFNTIQ